MDGRGVSSEPNCLPDCKPLIDSSDSKRPVPKEMHLAVFSHLLLAEGVHEIIAVFATKSKTYIFLFTSRERNKR